MIAILAALVAFCICKNVATDAETSNILALTSETFDQVIESNKQVLVEFYAPWCGYCQQFAPHYETIGTLAASDPDVDVVIAKVDGDTETALMEQMDVKGFPTLMLFSGSSDKGLVYDGSMGPEAVMDFVRTGRNSVAAARLDEDDDVAEGEEDDDYQFEKDGTEKNATVLETVEQVKDFEKTLKDSTPIVIGYVTGKDEKTYQEVAWESISLSYGVVSDEKVAKEMGVDFPSLVLHKSMNGELEVETLKGDMGTENVRNFVERKRYPIIGELTSDNIYDYLSDLEGLESTVYAASDSKKKTAMIDALKPFALGLRKSVRFVWIDTGSELFHDLEDDFSLRSDGFVLEVKQQDRYMFEGDVTDADTLKTFFDAHQAGTLEKFVKSEPIPESNDGPVFVIVANSFADVVGKDKDVFVDYYAPWCGHCQELEPKFEKIAEAFKNVDNLLIAKMDATANDVPPEIHQYPTLMFFPRGETKSEEYPGKREIKPIVEWLKTKTQSDTSGVTHEEL